MPEPADATRCAGDPGPCPEHGHHRRSLKQPGGGAPEPEGEADPYPDEDPAEEFATFATGPHGYTAPLDLPEDAARQVRDYLTALLDDGPSADEARRELAEERAHHAQQLAAERRATIATCNNHDRARAKAEAALDRARRLAERWRYTPDRKHGPRRELLHALGDEPATDTAEETGR